MPESAPEQAPRNLSPFSTEQGRAGIPGSLPQIPDHELIRCIGRGAYGEVWLARHARLSTLRAVKIVRRAQFDHDRPFQREFDGIRRYEPISRDHPNLVAILHVGGTDDCFFYVMELADDVAADVRRLTSSEDTRIAPDQAKDNQSLVTSAATYIPRTLRSELKRQGALPIDRCVEIALGLASALSHLHARGLVHRDVKPSNVIFVSSVPKLADIGLVAAVSDSRSFVGTEGYIPPDGPGTPSADCYALGKLLYELSTGHDRTAWPEPPSDLPTRPDRVRLLEFNAILHKACATDPRQRYRDAEEIHAELALLQRGESVKHKRRREWRWAVTKKIGLAATALTLMLLTSPLFRMLHHGKSTSTEAVRLYNLARDHARQLTDEDLKKSVAYLNQSIQVDPDFVPAYVTLFEVSTSVLIDGSWEKRFELQKNCARRLMMLAPNLGESHAALSWVKSATNDWAGAEVEIKRAIELNPNYAVAYGMYGCYMTWRFGRLDEAHGMFKKAQELDPTSPMHATCAGFPFYAKRQFAEAITQFRKALELRPNCGWARMWIGKAYEASGDYGAAITEFETLDLRSGTDKVKIKDRYELLRRAFTESGPHRYWQKVLEFYQASETKNLLEFDRYSLAGLYARLGEKEKALDELEKEEAAGDCDSWLNFEPCYDSLREEPRFKALLKKVGLDN